jgi:3-deoxy-D-manno-octulosonic acid kinase
LPSAYTPVGRGRVRAAIRRDLVDLIAPWLAAPHLQLPAGAQPLAGGRGATYRVALAGGPDVVVRLYRRGGLAARFARDRYLGVRPRPLRELAVTNEVRRRGVPTVEVVAARVEGRVAYRGALVTVAVPQARTLIDALRAAGDVAARSALATAAGRAVATMHAAGVFHADLNLTNLLVHPGPTGDEVLVLDFDRARLLARPLPLVARRRNLARMARSLRKLDPAGGLVGDAERAAFHAAYAAVGGTPTAATLTPCVC